MKSVTWYPLIYAVVPSPLILTGFPFDISVIVCPDFRDVIQSVVDRLIVPPPGMGITELSRF